MNLKIGNFASYLQVRKFKEDMKPLRIEDLGHGILIDYDSDGEIVGIEILEEIKPTYYDNYKETEC